MYYSTSMPLYVLGILSIEEDSLLTSRFHFENVKNPTRILSFYVLAVTYQFVKNVWQVNTMVIKWLIKTIP